MEVDERRELLSIVMTDLDDTELVAGALSDGTLRFLALTVMELDPEGQRLLCLEEPENGIHPRRVSALIGLLNDLAVDVRHPVDRENPLRQVIVTTHSPSVVACVDDDSLLVALTGRGSAAGRLSVRHLRNTWRDRGDTQEPPIAPGHLAAYLEPLRALDDEEETEGRKTSRVMDRKDLQELRSFPVSGAER